MFTLEELKELFPGNWKTMPHLNSTYILESRDEVTNRKLATIIHDNLGWIYDNYQDPWNGAPTLKEVSIFYKKHFKLAVFK